MIDSPMRWLWPLLASGAGAVTALMFQPFDKMSRLQIGLSLFGGASFATFVGPLVVSWLFGRNGEPQLAGAIYYGMATGSNALIPLFIRWLGRSFGVDTKGDAK